MIARRTHIGRGANCTKKVQLESREPTKNTALTLVRAGLHVQAQGDRRTNHGTQVEDGPEDTDELAFLAFCWV
jgi:hypothetical protein